MKEVLFPMKTFYPYLWLDMAIKAISLFIMISSMLDLDFYL